MRKIASKGYILYRPPPTDHPSYAGDDMVVVVVVVVDGEAVSCVQAMMYMCRVKCIFNSIQCIHLSCITNLAIELKCEL